MAHILTHRRLHRLRGLRYVGRRVAWELFTVARDQATALRRHDLGRAPLQLHVGCGAEIRPGWINIDLGPRSLVDLALDIRERWLLPGSCADLIHGEHVFEHLAQPRETAPFLAECFRVLRPGGRLSLSVPDAEETLRAYAAGDDAYFANARAKWHPAEESMTSMAQVNYVFRQGNEHQYAYDAATLSLVVARAGFVQIICPREIDPALDSPSRLEGGLRLIAQRP